MSNKATFPIKFKIILLTSLVLVTSISFYIFYATSLFQKDKKAYIYETSLANSKSISNEVSSKLTSLEKDINVLGRLYESKQFSAIDEIIEKTKYIKSFFYKRDGSLKYFSKELKSLDQTLLPSLIGLKSFRTKDELLLSYTIKYKNDFIGIVFDSAVIQSVIESNRIYNSALIAKDGTIILGKDIKVDFIKLISPFLSDHNAVKAVTYLNEKLLFSISQVSKNSLTAISIISEDKAYAVTKYLIKKSIYFAIFILALAGLIVIVFSRSLTSPIESLFKASKEIARGNFNQQIKIRTSDEIGHLGESFNFMSSEIQKYIAQMKEKARLENEVKVAKLVQEQYFPAQDIETDHYAMHSFATPASECGGDWWGYLHHNDKLITIMADATGHGVPAALLTSAINSAFNCVTTLIRDREEEFSPSEILDFLNSSISKSKTQILLTAFVCVIDLKTKKLSYSNASHLDALVIQKKEVITKSDIIPLIEAKGPRIGHKQESSYKTSQYQLSPGDQIILMTDGILECENNQQKQYGIRKFIKSMTTCSHFSSQAYRSAIIEAANSFRGEIEFNDDVTLLCLQVK